MPEFTTTVGGNEGEGEYTSDSQGVDQFMWEHKDFLILISAGNDGKDEDKDGKVDEDSMGTPGTAKNCITVGASENDRSNLDTKYSDLKDGDTKYPVDPLNSDKISDNKDGMAAFSSRGPCEDGRIKPDIVAPGTNIYSTRSSEAPGTGTWADMSGTIMASPLAAGAAALVRQFYVDNEKITPSAALIKATLLNGAKDISPGQYGTGTDREIPAARPNNVSGWGRLDLENSIFPKSPRVLRYYDEKSGLTTDQSNSYKITVGNAGEPLRVSLVWSDYPGSPAASKALVNDLDLFVTGLSGTGDSQEDGVNNAVGIDITNPVAGSYTIRVFAYNVAQGPQPYALVVSGGALSDFLPDPPNAPGNLSATAKSTTRIDLSWSDNSNNESGFKIERKVSGGSYSQIAKVGANKTSYSDTGLDPSTRYTYRVRAYNTGGNSSYSNTNSATTFSASPNAPGNLSAAAISATQIDLSWTDKSTNESGFKIEREVSGGTYSQIAKVGANATTYSDTQCKEETIYTYRVRAYNAGGNSAYSNKASATTPSTSGGGDGSEDDVENFVTRFYSLCLDRNPDKAGLAGWVDGLMDGSLTGSDVANGFVNSTEFINKNTNPDEYLQILYEAFFNRQPDKDGKQGWLDAMQNGATRQDVLNGFIYATEFAELCDDYGIKAFEGHITKRQREQVEAFVTRFYQLCLDRNPDTAGLRGWTDNLLDQVQTGADVANGFIYSQEFINKNTSNDEYLTILYKAFFNRNPDQAGWDVWLPELNSGRDRGYVLNGFLGSQEFIKLCEDYGITPS